MNLVSVKEIEKTMGGRLLFSGLTFGIDSESRIAIVGRNGSGKSTLLCLIAGLQEPDSGNISRNRQLKAAFLEQMPAYGDEQLIADFIMSGDSPEIKTIREYETVLSGTSTDAGSSRMAGLMAEMDRLDCWNLEARVHSVLSELGINDVSLKMSELSGGMLKKTALARTLVSDSNMIILDEPTNHLDIRTINWLEDYLKKSGKAILLVTHDRYFMDAICDRIFEIDDQSLYTYDGNYSVYLDLKTKREELEARTSARLANILRNEAEWIHRGPRARAGKDKKRKERFFRLQDELPGRKAGSDSFNVQGKRLGGRIVDIKNVGHSFSGKTVIEDFSYSFKKGDRIGLLGANGSGKSTLLNIVTGRLAPLEGSVVHGVNTRIGYYDQLSHYLPDDKKAIEFINETAEVITLKDGTRVSPAQFLERFLFPKNQLYAEIGRLSGGEKKKLYLLNILLANPNFLVFDEPTNDFDIQTLSILEDFLQNFIGCTVIVSHDRFFLDRTTDFLFILDGSGGVSGFSGDVMSYYEGEPEGEQPQAGKTEKSGKKDVNRRKKGLTFKEKKELEAIEDDIMSLETEREELDAYFMTAGGDIRELGEKKKRYDKVVAGIEEKYTRWEYLEAENNRG